jgi:hypothetical protein
LSYFFLFILQFDLLYFTATTTIYWWQKQSVLFPQWHWWWHPRHSKYAWRQAIWNQRFTFCIGANCQEWIEICSLIWSTTTSAKSMDKLYYYYTYVHCQPLSHHRTCKPIANWFLFFRFCHAFEIINDDNDINFILQCGAAPQVLSILFPNIAELAGVWVYTSYNKSFQLIAKEIMACIQSKTGDLSLSIFGQFTVSLFIYFLLQSPFLLGICIPFVFNLRSNCCLDVCFGWVEWYSIGWLFFYVNPSQLGSLLFHFLTVRSGMGPIHKLYIISIPR